MTAQDDLAVRPEHVRAPDRLERRGKAEVRLCRRAGRAYLPLRIARLRGRAGGGADQPAADGRTVSFLRVDRDALNCHYELIFSVEEARAQRLKFALPAATPPSVRSSGHGVRLKEYTPAVSRLPTCPQARRRPVAVVERLAGRAAAGAHPPGRRFPAPLPSAEPKAFSLPIATAEGVAYESGLVGVEGWRTRGPRAPSARPVDVAAGQRRLRARPAPVGDFGFAGAPPAVKIDVFRRPDYRFPRRSSSSACWTLSSRPMVRARRRPSSGSARSRSSCG